MKGTECTFVEKSKAADATLEGAMKDVAECAFAETSEVVGATLEFAIEGGGECAFVETSKPADATLEGAMKGIAECTVVQHEASSYSQLQHGRQRGVEQKERVPLQKAGRTAQEERVPLQKADRTAQEERVKEQREFLETSEVAGASLDVAMRGVAECTFAETSKPADATFGGCHEGHRVHVRGEGQGR